MALAEPGLHVTSALAQLLHCTRSTLQHLELSSCASLTDLAWLSTLASGNPTDHTGTAAPAAPPSSSQQHAAPPLPWPPPSLHAGLTCLGLRGCVALAPEQVVHVATALGPRLTSLDLSECSLVDNTVTSPLLHMTALQVREWVGSLFARRPGCAQSPRLEAPGVAATPGLYTQVLRLSHTQVGDALLDALTYAPRMELWARTHRQPVPEQAAGWPRLARLHHLELQGTRVTGQGVEHLAAQPTLRFVDVRGTQVTVLRRGAC